MIVIYGGFIDLSHFLCFQTEEFSSAMKPYAELKDERVYVNMPYLIIVIQKD